MIHAAQHIQRGRVRAEVAFIDHTWPDRWTVRLRIVAPVRLDIEEDLPLALVMAAGWRWIREGQG